LSQEATDPRVEEEKPATKVYGYLAEFSSPKELYHAAEKIRDAGFAKWDAHSPYPIHGMDAAMGLGRSRLPWFVFFGGLTGFCTAFFLASMTQTNVFGRLFSWLPGGMPYPTIVQAKPDDITTTPAFFPVMFELTILLSAFATLFGVLGLMKLPRLNHPLFESETFARFSDDGFFISIESDDPLCDPSATLDLLTSIGAQQIEVVNEVIEEGGEG